MRTGFALALVALIWLPSASVVAQDGSPFGSATVAPAEPDAIPLYGANAAGNPQTENWAADSNGRYFVRNVTRPTLTPFLPAPGTATGAAVIVAPGGAFMGLAITHEGWAVAQALADRGIAAFVLKYRLLPTPADQGEALAAIGRVMAQANDVNANGSSKAESPPRIGNPQTTEDGLAALALIRARAGEWGVDPARVGMIGFSAGAMTSLNTVLAAQDGTGPDFIGYIYGPQDAVKVPPAAPPLFNAIALDDPLFPNNGFPVARAWQAAGRPVEIHAYERGNHGFGLGVPGTTTTMLLDQFVGWMAMHGFLAVKDAR